MKKRIVATLLFATLMITGLTGCGSAKVNINSNEPEISAYTESPTKSYPTNAIEYESEACYAAGEAEEYLCGTGYDYFDDINFNTEEYSIINENGFKKVSLSPLSTFSADVDTASYSNLRRFINNGYKISDIPKGAVRTEELINYFSYNYNLPKEDQPFEVTTEIGLCPWNPDSKLLSVGIKTQKIDFKDAAPSNIVFLIDVSGSMDEENKLPLLVKSFKMMVEELGEKDRVSIVTYASGNRVVLKGVPASDKGTITEALDGLMAGGGTNGGEGIITAYKLAEENFIKDGNNRVILATDGDLNIGISNQSDLKALIEKESRTGVFLTVLGFGMGNYSDSRLETLADYGNGNYAYIDDLTEAKKVLCEELGATFVTVAKDVKLQVEFNPAVVSSYRLIGYENRLMNDEDFNDDSKDAGEIGAGHTVTALYELVTVDKDTKDDSGLKYQKSQLTEEALNTEEWLTVSIRYKEPDKDESKLLTYPVGTSSYKENNTQDFLWAATVAEFAQIVRQESYVENSNLDIVYGRLSELELRDEYKENFKKMVMQLMVNQ